MNLARHDCCATEAANPETISDKKLSEVNMKTRLAAICLSLIVSAQAQLALAQSAQLSSDQAWELVKQTTLGEKLVVKLKDGKKLKGEKILVSDSELSLSIKNQQVAQFKRDEIRQVWRWLPPDPEKQRLYQGIGVGVGLLGGLAIAVAASRPGEFCNDCRGRGIGLTAAVVGTTIAGALVGRKLAGGKRILIYHAP
jgi:ferric-dicitrate binding protein FerR (iron transport regulator)